MKNFKVNDRFFEKIKIQQKHLFYFKKITGDKNPIHIKKSFAQKFGYSEPVVYGLLTSSFLSKIIGNKIPGPGALWTNCNLSFKKPVFLNDEITIEARLAHISNSTSMIKLIFIVRNQNNEIVLEGDSDVKTMITKKENKKKRGKLKTNFVSKIGDKNKEKIKPIIIIGGSSEIGNSLVNKLSKNDFVISTFYKNKKNKLKKNKNLIYRKLNVLDLREIDNFCNEIKKKFNRIKSLIYLPANKLNLSKVGNTSVKNFLEDYKINAIGFIKIFQLLEKNLINGSANIILMSTESVNNFPSKDQSSYVSSKAALSSIGKSIAVEYADRGIKLNIIAPGLIETKFTKLIPDVPKELYKNQNISGELVKIDEVVKLIISLLRNNSPNNNGLTYYLNTRG